MQYSDILIYENESIKSVMKKLDKTAEKVLLVVDSQDKLLGTITDGDIRRYILKGKGLDSNICEIYNKKPVYLKKEDFSIDKVKSMLLDNKIELIPILDEKDRIVDFNTWSQIFSDGKTLTSCRSKVNVPVVIMAGGKGTRLDPFTKILPKSLIPIGERPIVEVIIEEFKKQGVREYYLMLNHKAKMVEAYFDNIDKDYNLTYIHEKDFRGTAGSLNLLDETVGDTIIVSNCDVIIKANFEEVVNFHKENKASLTILSAIQHHKIPYGVIDFKEKGEVTNITEKPEYSVSVNTGVYVLSKEVLGFISEESPFDMTDLIKKLIENNKKVMTYPVNESAYMDVGQWEEYKKSMDKLTFLNK